VRAGPDAGAGACEEVCGAVGEASDVIFGAALPQVLGVLGMLWEVWFRGLPCSWLN
jgi:hypothetical protein